jgi:hypothetical protein
MPCKHPISALSDAHSVCLLSSTRHQRPPPLSMGPIGTYGQLQRHWPVLLTELDGPLSSSCPTLVASPSSQPAPGVYALDDDNNDDLFVAHHHGTVSNLMQPQSATTDYDAGPFSYANNPTTWCGIASRPRKPCSVAMPIPPASHLCETPMTSFRFPRPTAGLEDESLLELLVADTSD